MFFRKNCRAVAAGQVVAVQGPPDFHSDVFDFLTKNQHMKRTRKILFRNPIFQRALPKSFLTFDGAKVRTKKIPTSLKNGVGKGLGKMGKDWGMNWGKSPVIRPFCMHL